MKRLTLLACAVVFAVGLVALSQSTSAATQRAVSAEEGVVTEARTAIPETPRVCTILYRSLGVGSWGDDVKGLQEYLSENGYFTVTPTGYFGPITQTAVTKWQANEGLSAVGVVGPLTRARIAKRCTMVIEPPVPQPPPEAQLSATPTSGKAPLKVTFSTWISGFRTPDVTYTLDFGDGTSQTPTSCLAPADACIEAGKDTHVYRKDGTYTAALYRITDPCRGNPLCMAPTQLETLGTATIVVGAKACTREYNPVCGSKPIVCITTPCDPIPETYGNRCTMEADGATFLYEGACKKPTENRSPVISSVSGPTTLAVNAKGTWSVTAYDPENGSLTYTISWGDELLVPRPLGASMDRQPEEQTTTFTHSYAKAGKYTVRVVVRDNAGNEAETTTTVRVGSDVTTACPAVYDPVCGMPSGCANTCPPGMFCAMMCQIPDPVTYGNNCLLEAAGASLLHSGECTASSGRSTVLVE